MKTAIARRMEDLHFAKIYVEEAFVVDILEEVARWMEEHDISYADLARKMKLSEHYIERLFAEEKRMSLRRLASVVDAIGGLAKFSIVPKNGGDDE